MKEERFAPVIKQRLESITTKDGGQALFETEIIGIPTPTIIWYKDEEMLHPSEEFTIAYSEENVASLYIHDVLPEDAGNYIVVAKNELGTVTTSATLIVEGKNSVVILEVRNYGTVSCSCHEVLEIFLLLRFWTGCSSFVLVLISSC